MSFNSENSKDSDVMTKLEENAGKLNISVEELIDQYFKLGLYEDDYYEPEPITRDEFLEILRKNRIKDEKRGIPRMKHYYGEIIGLFNKYED